MPFIRRVKSLSQTSVYPPLVLASRNQKKAEEIRELLGPAGFDVRGLAEFPEVGEVLEDGQTFGENAAKKARETALATGLWSIGEDSGLRVDELNGAPGIYSARFSDPGATDERNNLKLQRELQGVPEHRRGAEYVCHVAMADATGRVRLSFEDTCRGRIVTAPRGDHGFGYDPYFLISEYHRTFGELSALVKRQLSHRARAFRRLIPELKKLLLGLPTSAGENH